MKKIIYLLLLCGLLVGCREGLPAETAAGNSYAIPYPTDLHLEGPAGVLHQFDIENSTYYPSHDFYNMKSNDNLTILENFKTTQQTTETTCGPACLIMLLEYYGKYEGQSDVELYEMRDNKDQPTTILRDMFRILESLDEWDIYSTYNLDNPDTVPKEMIADSLKAGKPIVFGDDEWGGHWRIIIGYDDMGDDIEANDVLIIADPYDTTDHYQDGYTVIPFQRLFYNWSNRFDPDFTHNLFMIASPKTL